MKYSLLEQYKNLSKDLLNGMYAGVVGLSGKKSNVEEEQKHRES